MAIFCLMASFGLSVSAQTEVPPAGQDYTGDPNASAVQGAARNTDDTVPNDPYADATEMTTLVQQQAEQNTKNVAQNVESKLWPEFGSYNETYEGLSAFWGDDIISNFFANIGQLIGKWLSELINGWVADAVQMLTGFLRIFVLNPNIAVNGLSSTPGGDGQAVDDISPYVRQGADIMYGIAVDLLLLLFILCIWKYWAEAAWRGGGNLMGAVGRLIFTAGLLLAWPTIYAFEIQITNEMIKTIYFNSADQVAMLDAAMAAAVKGGLVAKAALLANATAPVAGQVLGGVLAGGAGGIVLGTVGSLISFAGLIIYLVLGGVLIAELVYILVLKAIQTALLTAQYMFAPIFLVFFAVPDTESVTSGFVRSFVEVSLWTFVWVGLLKIMVIVILSNFNPWGKIVMAIGILQIMIQVPSFLSRAQISPMSDFISAGLITGGLLSAGKALGSTLGSRAMHFANAVGNFGFAGAKGAPKSQNVELNGLGSDVARPDLLKDIRDTQKTGNVPNKKGGGPNGPMGPDGKPINPIDPKKPGGPDGKKPGEGDGITPPGGAKPVNPAAGGAGATPPGSTPNAAGVASGLGDAAKKGAAIGTVAAAMGGLAAASGGPTGLGGLDKKDDENKPGVGPTPPVADPTKQLNAAGGVNDPTKKGDQQLDANGKHLKAAGPPVTDKDKTALAAAAAGMAVSAVAKGGDAKTGANPTGADAKGKDLAAGMTAADLKNAGNKTGQGQTATGQPGQQQLELELDSEGKPVAGTAVPGLKPPGSIDQKGQAGNLNGPDGANGKQTVAGGKTQGPSLDLAGATTNVTAVGKPGANPTGKSVIPPMAAAGLGMNAVATGANLDPTLKGAGGDEVLVEGDKGEPLTQVRENAVTGRIISAAGAVAAAKIDAAKTVPGAGLKPGGQAQGTAQTTVTPAGNAASPNLQGAHAQGPQTQFTTSQGGNNAPPVQPPTNFNGPDGGDGGDDNGGGAGGGFSGPAAQGSAPSSPKQGSKFDGYMQAGYRHVPYRVASAAIRLAQGATLAPSASGRPTNVYDNQGHMMHVRFGEGATDEQKAMQIMSGAYGELMSSDAEAYDAARQSAIDSGEHKPKGLAQRAAAGILAYNGSSWTQTASAKQSFQRSMAKHAALGAQAYVNGEEGNAYTNYLVGRYGPMSSEQQAWAVHMMTDDSSPESGFSWKMGPATDGLIQSGIGINSCSRAVAANTSVMKAQPWLKGASIRGGVEYMRAKGADVIPEGTPDVVKDAWYGNNAQAVPAQVANTWGALTLAMGEQVCSDYNTVDTVANMVGANGRPEDYVGAYNSLKAGGVAMARVEQRYSQARSMGGGTQTISASGGGYSGGGQPVQSQPTSVQTSVSGSVVGGGAPVNSQADVDMFLDGPQVSSAPINPGMIPTPNVNLPNPQGGATIANLRMQQGNATGGGAPQHTSVRVPGGNVGSSQGQVVIGQVSGFGGGGGGSMPDQHAIVDVETSVSGQVIDHNSLSAAALQSAVGQFGGSSNMVQQVVADLRANGMEWKQICDPGRSDNDPGKYAFLETAIQAYSQNPTSMPAVAMAANAVGASKVGMADVQIVQSMMDSDPRWSQQNIDYSSVYTARAIVEAHQQDPQTYGDPVLTKDYVDSVRLDPRFIPRPMPVRNQQGAIVRHDQSPVPRDRLMKRVLEQALGRDKFGGNQA